MEYKVSRLINCESFYSVIANAETGEPKKVLTQTLRLYEGNIEMTTKTETKPAATNVKVVKTASKVATYSPPVAKKKSAAMNHYVTDEELDKICQNSIGLHLSSNQISTLNRFLNAVIYTKVS